MFLYPLCLSALLFLETVFAAPTADIPTPVLLPEVVVVSPSKYPQPTTNEFKYSGFDPNNEKDKGDQFIIHSAFRPFADILGATFVAIGDTSDVTIDTWFPPTVKRAGKKDQDRRGYVRGVFARMFKFPSSPAERIADMVANSQDYAKECDPKKHTKAYLTRDTGHIHICEHGLAQPMIADKDNCNSLGDKVSKAMRSLSGTLIHEFMHWNEIGDKALDFVGHIGDAAYNPAGCMRLGNNPDEGENQKAFRNADSYR
ncbi:hypothetical protein EJ08DRAFT_684378 [Tothia fuscella]|uniref:Lysine-specific metallo-endopeptidase domain-containing protein n=1 Tax=Tothia fuscella TaxID=1048955 RepID=A0A9P4NDZ8_9PEZI|nr:hypothetical protein EJ08DRAFT_684378 [Tothia fuscella]